MAVGTYSPQYSLPTSDNGNSGFKFGSTYTAVDEGFGAGRGTGSGPDDNSSLVESEPLAAPTFWIKFGMGTVDDPTVNTGHIIRTRARQYQSGVQIDYSVQLFQGSTQIGSAVMQVNIGSVWTTYTWNVPNAVVALITDYSDLVVRCYGEKIGGGANSSLAVSTVELELPQKAAGAPWWPTYAIKADSGALVLTSNVKAARPGIVISRGRDAVRALAPTRAGDAAFELDNRAGTYGPAGSLQPGDVIEVEATFDSYVYDLFDGLVDAVEQHPEQDRRSVSVRALGKMSRLIGKKISTALYQNIKIDAAIGHVHDAVSWPSGERTLEVAETTLDWWWLDDEDAFEAIRDLVNMEGPHASAHEHPNGKFHFHNRDHLAKAAESSAIQSTFRDVGASPLYSRPFTYDDGLRDVINAVIVTVRERSAKALSVVWDYLDTVVLAPEESRQFTARDSTGDPFTGALTPVEGQDYNLSAGNLLSVSLDRTSGVSVTISLLAGPIGATITDLQLRAQPVTVDVETQIKETMTRLQVRAITESSRTLSGFARRSTRTSPRTSSTPSSAPTRTGGPRPRSPCPTSTTPA